jgi:hypothetical protein
MAVRRAAIALAAAVASFGLDSGAAAAEPQCPLAQPARVDVSLDDPEPSLEPGAGMEGFGAEDATRRGAAYRHLGVTTSRVEWQSEVEAAIEKSSGRVCARPERVSITLRHPEHSVRIARELPRGGCLFRETEAHEQRHVSVNRATLRRAAAELEAAARSWAATAVGRGATEQSAMAALQAGLRTAIAPALEAMQAARDAQHREIERPEEYQRLGRVCPEEHRAIRERTAAQAR